MKRKKGLKLADLWELYRLRSAYLSLRPSSRRIYLQGWDAIERFHDMEANKITRPMVLDFRDDNYDKRSYCRLGLMILGFVLQFGYDRGYCNANPVRGITGLPPKLGWKRWTKEELEKVMAVAPEEIRRAIVLALYTGQRVSDLALMRWDNYDGTYIHIIQKKTRKPLSIPVHPILKQDLDTWRGPSDYILHSKTGLHWQSGWLSMNVTKVVRGAGIADKVIHGIRKTTASLLAELGCSVYEIAAITGQSLQEVVNYTRQVDQKALAQRAVDRWSKQYS